MTTLMLETFSIKSASGKCQSLCDNVEAHWEFSKELGKDFPLKPERNLLRKFTARALKYWVQPHVSRSRIEFVIVVINDHSKFNIFLFAYQNKIAFATVNFSWINRSGVRLKWNRKLSVQGEWIDRELVKSIRASIRQQDKLSESWLNGAGRKKVEIWLFREAQLFLAIKKKA